MRDGVGMSGADGLAKLEELRVGRFDENTRVVWRVGEELRSDDEAIVGEKRYFWVGKYYIYTILK